MRKALGITGLVLAGGQGRRMGSQDKGLLPLDGKPLIAWALERLSPQVDEILISANRNLSAYARWGYPVLLDLEPDGGPLYGVLRGLETAHHPLLACTPCDTPHIPADLAQRLRDALLLRENAVLAVAAWRGRVHRLCFLCRRSIVAQLRAFLEGGGRRVQEWQQTLVAVEVPFDDHSADPFINVNTPAILQNLQRPGGDLEGAAP